MKAGQSDFVIVVIRVIRVIRGSGLPLKGRCTITSTGQQRQANDEGIMKHASEIKSSEAFVVATALCAVSNAPQARGYRRALSPQIRVIRDIRGLKLASLPPCSLLPSQRLLR